MGANAGLLAANGKENLNARKKNQVIIDCTNTLLVFLPEGSGWRAKDVWGEEVNRTGMIGHHRGIGITESVYEKIRLTHQTQVSPEMKAKWQNDPLKFWEVII